MIYTVYKSERAIYNLCHEATAFYCGFQIFVFLALSPAGWTRQVNSSCVCIWTFTTTVFFFYLFFFTSLPVSLIKQRKKTPPNSNTPLTHHKPSEGNNDNKQTDKTKHIFQKSD